MKERFTTYFSEKQLNCLKKEAKEYSITVSELLREILNVRYNISIRGEIKQEIKEKREMSEFDEAFA